MPQTTDFLDKLNIINLGAGMLRDAKEFSDQFGFIHDEVTVTVVGTPHCLRSTLYRLAASIGFGLVRRLGPVSSYAIPAPGSIAIQYDAADNAVTFHLRYSTSLTIALASASFVPGKPGPAALSESLPIFVGPANEVRGGKWNFVGPGLGTKAVETVVDVGEGIATGLIRGPIDIFGVGTAKGTVKATEPAFVLPELTEWEGKTLLTKSDKSSPPDPNVPANSLPTGPTMNPRPAADQRSRGTWVNLVYTALTTPATNFDLIYPDTPNTLDAYRGR